MSRKSNSNRSGNGNFNYNRQSGGYQKNLYRQKMKEEGIKQPKTVDQKKFRITAIVLGVIWIVASILLVMYLGWKGLLIGLVIGVALVGGIYLYLQKKQNEMIKYYKKIGMTEQMYINELKKRGTDAKQIEAFKKAWRKTKVD